MSLISTLSSIYTKIVKSIQALYDQLLLTKVIENSMERIITKNSDRFSGNLIELEKRKAQQ